MVAEVTMIVVDTSYYLLERGFFETQREAIRLYCRAKIRSNPENTVGAVTTDGHNHNLYRPTSHVEPFLKQIDAIPMGFEIFTDDAIEHSQLGFIRIPEHMKKRILVFAGGPAYPKELLQKFGRILNARNVGVDVVSFVDKDQVADEYKIESFQAFVAAAQKDHNSHFAYVPHNSSSIRDILLRSNILAPSEAATVPLMEPHEMKKNHLEYLEKHFPCANEDEALSSCQPGLL